MGHYDVAVDGRDVLSPLACGDNRWGRGSVVLTCLCASRCHLSAGMGMLFDSKMSTFFY